MNVVATTRRRALGPRTLGSWALSVLMAGAPLLGVAVPATAQEGAIPVMVQTRPQIPGARFSLDGHEFVADQNGLALTTVAESGTYELEVVSPRIERDGTTHSFSMWAGGEHARSRRLEVGSFTLLEAGFDTAHQVSFSFTDESGAAIDPARMDSATIVEGGGGYRYLLTGDESTVVVVSRAVPGETGVGLQPVSYRLEEAVVEGEDVPVTETNIEVGADPAVVIPLALPATASEAGEAPAGPASSDRERDDGRSGALLWGVLAAVLFALVLAVAGMLLGRPRPGGATRLGAFRKGLSERVSRIRARPAERAASHRTMKWLRRPRGGHGPRSDSGSKGGRRWPALPWRRSARADDTGAPMSEQAMEAEWPVRGSHHVRVRLRNGRIIDGWTRPTPQAIDDQVLNLSVERVYDEDGNSAVSTPLDSFLLRSEVALIWHINESTAPPPNIAPTAAVVRLEDNDGGTPNPSGQEPIDLRDAPSTSASKPWRANDGSAS